MMKLKTPTSDPNNVMDQYDWKSLLFAILDQSIDDYIKLQHPATRVKKYLQESYLTAISLLFDSDFELENIVDGFNCNMSTETLIKEILESDKADIAKLQAHTVQSTIEYWDLKPMKVFDYIPSTVNVCGYVYEVNQGDKLSVDSNDKKICLNKKGDISEYTLLHGILIAVCLEEDLDLTTTELRKLSKALYAILKINNCFTAVVKDNQKSES